MYKVFVDEREVRIHFEAVPGGQYIRSPEALKGLWQQLPETPPDAVLDLYGPDASSLWQWWCDLFTWIEAAGGLVQEPQGSVLMIYRWEKWDLPKGKAESGEDPAETALREVREECGIPRPEIVAPLPPTYHTYPREGKHFLKKTWWYHMRLPQKAPLIPQEEEDITRAEWCTREQSLRYAATSYGNIKALIQDFWQDEN